MLVGAVGKEFCIYMCLCVWVKWYGELRYDDMHPMAFWCLPVIHCHIIRHSFHHSEQCTVSQNVLGWKGSFGSLWAKSHLCLESLPYLIADFFLILLPVTGAATAEEDDGNDDDDQQNGNYGPCDDACSVGSCTNQRKGEKRSLDVM